MTEFIIPQLPAGVSLGIPSGSSVPENSFESTIVIENQGTSIGVVGTINALAPLSATVLGDIATLTAVENGVTFVNNTITLGGPTWSVGPGLGIEENSGVTLVQISPLQSTIETISLPNPVTVGNYLAFVALTGSTPPPSTFDGFSLVTSGQVAGYYSAIYGEFATTAVSPTLVASGAVNQFRNIYEYANVQSVLGTNPTIHTTGTVTPFTGTFALSEGSDFTALSMLLVDNYGGSSVENFTTPAIWTFRDAFSVIPFVSEGFDTVELTYPSGGSQAIFNCTLSAGTTQIYTTAPSLIMIGGGNIGQKEIFTNPITLENQGTFIGSARTLNAGSNASFSTDGTTATLNAGEVYVDIGGTIEQVTTFFPGGNISFSGTSGDITLSSTGGSILIESNGTSIGTASTLNAGTGITAAVSGGVATLTTSGGGGGGGTLGVNYAGTIYPTIAAGSGLTLAGAGSVLTASTSGGGGGATYPQIVQSAYVTSGGTLTLPNPVTVGNYIAVFVNQATSLANFNGVPLLQTIGSATQQSFLFGQVATSTTPPSAAIAGNGFICEVSGASSASSGTASLSQINSGGNYSSSWFFNYSVTANSIVFAMNACSSGVSNADDAIFTAPIGANWLTSGMLTNGQAYGFFVWQIQCPATKTSQKFAYKSYCAQGPQTVAILKLQT